MGENRPTIKDTETTREYTDTEKAENSCEKLSGPDPKDQATGYRLLIGQGVAPAIAQRMVYEDKIPLTSIEETIKNGLAKQKAETKFKLRPGYIVKTLNSAKTEGKQVTATKASKEFKQMIDEQKNTKGLKHMTDEEMTKERDRVVEVLREPMTA